MKTLLRRFLQPKRVFILVVCLQLLLLMFTGVSAWRREMNPVTIATDSSFWQSYTLEKGWNWGTEAPAITPDTPMVREREEWLNYPDTRLFFNDYVGVFAAHAPDCYLTSGGYTVTVHYETDSVQYLTPIRGDGTGTLLDGGNNHVRIRPGTDHISFDIYILQDMEHFQVAAWYSGEGTLVLKDIEIRANGSMQRMALLGMLSLFLLADLCYVYRRRIAEKKLVFWGLLGLIAVISLPLTQPWIGLGHDLAFHLRRVEAAAQGLMRGEFPVRMASFINEDAGYASSIMYCDLFLYFPTLLRLIGFPMTWAYKLYVLACNAATVLVGWACFRRIAKEDKAALLMTLLWVTAAYRFSNVYYRAAVGEYTAVIFLPMVLLALYRMYFDSEPHSAAGNALLLTTGMAGIAASHILTLEMTSIVMAVFALIMFRKTFRVKTLLTWVGAGVATVLLSVWFLVPFADYYLNVPMWVNCYTDASDMMIQSYGVSIAEFLDFFRDVFHMSEMNFRRSQLMTPGLGQMAAVLLGCILLIRGEGDKVIRRLLIAAGAMLALCSDLFPWNALAVTPLGGILCMVQFPWRYESLACLFIAVLGGVLFLRLMKTQPDKAAKLAVLCAAACILMTMYYTGTYIGGKDTFYWPHNAAEMDSAHGSGGEYLRALPLDNVKFQADWDVKEPKRGTVEAGILSHDGPSMDVWAKTGAEEATLDFIYSNYPYYRVTDNEGREYKVTDSDDLHMRIVLPAGFDGTLSVRYEPPMLWHISEWVSLITFIGLLLGFGIPALIKSANKH